MTLKECYASIGGNYDEVLRRMKNEERVKKFAMLFLKDPCYSMLLTAMKEKDYDTAFRVAHTMKGVCINLAFTEISESSSRLTEYLRVRDITSAEECLTKVNEDYERTIQAILALD